MFVQSGVDPDIHGAHLLFGKFLDLLDSTTSPVLETDSMQPFMEVDGVFAGNNFAHGRAFLLSVWWHFDGLERQLEISTKITEIQGKMWLIFKDFQTPENFSLLTLVVTGNEKTETRFRRANEIKTNKVEKGII